MFKKTSTRIALLAVAGVVVLSGAVYVTASWAAGSADAAPPVAPALAQAAVQTAAPAAIQSTQTTDPEELRATILDMLKDRMGLTGADAEAWADQMIERMQQVFPDGDFQDMLDWCGRYIDDEAPSGWNGRPGGMMGWGTGPGATAPDAGDAGTDSGSWTPPCFR